MAGANVATVTALTARATQEAGANLTRLEVSELADGSGRWAAILTMQDGRGGEMRLRITAPAPDDAPLWARVHNGYEVKRLEAHDF